MRSRKKISDSVQAEVLLQSRRRCCACYGLHSDESVKKGQIAHLDRNRANNRIENPVFLCFDHHDEYDSTTSQSKGLLRVEIEQYRDELNHRFGSWSAGVKRDELLNFIASQIDLDQMVDAAIKVASGVVFYGEEHAFDVLVTDAVDYCDSDLYLPHLVVLDHFASWGWLTYTEEERVVQDDMPRIFISVKREPVCDEVALRLFERARNRSDVAERMRRTASFRAWSKVTHIGATEQTAWPIALIARQLSSGVRSQKRARRGWPNERVHVRVLWYRNHKDGCRN